MIVLCNIKLDDTLYNCRESTHMYQNKIKWRCIDTYLKENGKCKTPILNKDVQC